jgi:hypothetical protein
MWDFGFQDVADRDDMGITVLMKLEWTLEFGIKSLSLDSR